MSPINGNTDNNWPLRLESDQCTSLQAITVAVNIVLFG